MPILLAFLLMGAADAMGSLSDSFRENLELSSFVATLMPFFVFIAFAVFILLTAGRLLAGSINVNPHIFFRLSALLGLIGVALVMSGNQVLVLIGIALGGLGFANIWPMLFSSTIEEKPERASELSGLMCMAISGGALMPLAMGRLVDSGVATTMAFVVPAAST